MAAYQAPPSLGFSRQEHWSGLPFPSPMHESEKSKWSRSVVSDSLWPHGLQTTRLLHPWDFPGTSTGVGCQCLLCLMGHRIIIFFCSCCFWSNLMYLAAKVICLLHNCLKSQVIRLESLWITCKPSFPMMKVEYGYSLGYLKVNKVKWQL